jgi:hypothetical protein
MEKGFGQYADSSSKRVNLLKSKLREYNYTNPDDIMMTIMEVFREGDEFIPDVGKYYTFIYSPKTKGITYDEFPLVAVTNIERWGFKGINFHWSQSRNYTWFEVNSKLLEIKQNEIDYLRSLSYAKFRTK